MSAATPGAVLGLNRLGLLRIAEKRDGEAAVGLEVVVPGQELALAAFCTQAFPVIQRMGLAGLGWLKRGRAEKTRSVAKIVRIQGFTDARQSL